MRSFVSNATCPRGGGGGVADGACVDFVRSAGGGSDDELAEPLLTDFSASASFSSDSGGLSSSSSLSDCTTYFRFARAKPDFFAPVAEASPAREDCSWASSFGCRGACGEDSMGCDCSVASWPVGPCVTEAGSSGRHGPSSGCSLIAIVRLTGPEDRSVSCFARVLPSSAGTLASLVAVRRNCQDNHVTKCSLSSPLELRRCSRGKLFH